ncbi:MAG: MFS transporter, partial [SAR202 cluster bacterium]|nr:MFS transporter [SAR202 cluster bacterium]
FYAAFMVVTLGSSIGGFLPVITAINHWFNRRRSLAMAIAMSGINFGGILVPLMAFGIDSHGFRWTTGGIGAALLAVSVPAFLFIRNRPEDYGLRPDGDQPGGGAPASRTANGATAEPDLTARQAIRTRAFWVILTSNIASGVPLTSLMVHLVPKLTDMGYSLGGASVVVTVFTVVGLPATFLAGYLGDRLPKPPLICAALLLQGGAIILLAFSNSPWLAWVFAPMYGLAFGARIPLTTAMRGEYFGRKAFATISGLSQLPSSLAMMAGPLFAGYLFDLQQSYFVPFAAFAVMSVAGAGLILLARKPSATAAA